MLFNTSSPEGTEIADYYGQVHPGVRLVGLTGVTTDEEISADEYLATVRPQILAALDDTTDVLVTTKGLPLRITTVPRENPGTYTDPFGVDRTIFSTTWKKFSSLESELTRIDTFSTWEQLGDQTHWLPTGTPGAPHPSGNPYYNAGDGFDRETYGIRLATRLDAFSVADVQASIDRAQQAFVGPNSQTSGPFHFVLDDDPNAQEGFPSDTMELLRDNVLMPRKLPCTYDGTDAFVRTASGPVLGYVSHGVHGGAPSGYLVDADNGIDFTLANGAVFHSHESYNAYSFEPNGNQFQGLVAEWIAAGGTAGVGHVQEPLSGCGNVTNEDIMFQMLLDGYTWAEAAWSATAQLSYVNTVVGDPLMVYHQLIAGDANLDGTVGAADAAIVTAHLGQIGHPGGQLWHIGDFNSDGRVSAADLAVLNANWGSSADWVGGATAQMGDVMQSRDTAETGATIPEPSGLALLLTAALPLCRFRYGSRIRQDLRAA